MVSVNESECTACGACADVCPEEAITVEDVAVIDAEKMHRMRSLRRRVSGFRNRGVNVSIEPFILYHSERNCNLNGHSTKIYIFHIR